MELTELPQTVANMPWISALPAQDGYSASTGDAAVRSPRTAPQRPPLRPPTTGAVRVHFDGAPPPWDRAEPSSYVVIGQRHQRVVVNDAPPGHIAAASPFAAHAPPANSRRAFERRRAGDGR